MSIHVGKNQYDISAIPMIIIIIASIFEFIVADILTDKKYPKHTEQLLSILKPSISEIDEQIKNYIREAIGGFKYCNKEAIGGTFHLRIDLFDFYDNKEVEGQQEGLLQITDYIGNPGGANWRFTLSTKGIIGRCLRTGKSHSANFGSINEYEKRMINEFGYTEVEIRNHTKTARSYYAIPAFLSNKLIGVLYFFSTEYQVFPSIVDEVKLQHTTEVIVAYLEGRGILKLL